MSTKPNIPQNLPIHPALAENVTAEEAKSLQELLLNPQAEVKEEQAKTILSIFEKANHAFEEDLFSEPINYLLVTRRGLRVEDMKSLMGEDWNFDEFIKLTSCFGMPFVGVVEGIVFIPSPQLKGILLSKISEADQISFTKDIAHYLLKKPANDIVRQSEVLFHMMQAGMVEESAEYFASLHDQSLQPSADLMGSCFVSGEAGEKLIEAILVTPIAGRFDLYCHFINEVFVSVSQNASVEAAEKLIKLIEAELTKVMGEKNSIDNIQLLSLTGLRLASVYMRKNQVDDVKRYFDNSIGFLSNLMAQNPPVDAFAWHNIDAIFNMGMICVDMHQPKAAYHCMDIALDVLDKKVAAEPEGSDRYLYQATWYITIARVCMRINDKDAMKGYFDRGRDYMDHALTQKASYIAENPENIFAKQDMMGMYNEMADLLHACGYDEDAKATYEKALAVGEELASSHPDRIEMLVAPTITYDRMGKMFAEMQNIEEAKEYFEKSLNLRKELSSRYENDFRLAFDLAGAYHNMASLYTQVEDKSPAEQYLIGQLQTIRKVSDAQPQQEHAVMAMLDAIISLSDFYAIMENWDKAYETLSLAQATLKPVLGMQVSEHVLNRVAGIHYKTGMALYKLEKAEEAKQNMKTAAELWRQLTDATNNPIYKEQFQKANEYLVN